MKRILPFAVIASAAMLLTACNLFNKGQKIDVNSKEEAQAYLIKAVEDTAKDGAKLTLDARAQVEYGDIDADIRISGKTLIGKNYTENYGKIDVGLDATIPMEVETEEGTEGEGDTEEPTTEMVDVNDTITLEGYIFKNRLIQPPVLPEEDGEGEDGDTGTLTPVELKQTYSVYGKLYDRHAVLNTLIPFLFPLEEGEDHVELKIYEPTEEIDFNLDDEPEEGEEPTLPTSYTVKGETLTLAYDLAINEDITLPVTFTVKDGDITAKIAETTINYAGDEDDMIQGEATATFSLNAELKSGGQEELRLQILQFDEADYIEEEPDTPVEGEDGTDIPLV